MERSIAATSPIYEDMQCNHSIMCMYTREGPLQKMADSAARENSECACYLHVRLILSAL